MVDEGGSLSNAGVPETPALHAAVVGLQDTRGKKQSEGATVGFAWPSPSRITRTAEEANKSSTQG